MVPPDLRDPAQRAAYHRELQGVGLRLRRTGIGVALIGALLVRLDNQSAYLKDITVGLARITQDMPLDVVRAIADNFGLDPTRDANP